MQLSAEPTLPILWVSSDIFPIKTANIKKGFLAQPPTFAGHPGISTFTIQHPGELGKKLSPKRAWPNSCFYAFKETWT